MKAIETTYKGYRFRSRLEARWAVFFDTLGLKWGYEEEGYDLNGTWYLPDFCVRIPSTRGYWPLLPDDNEIVYVEIKPEVASWPKDFEKAWLLTAEQPVPVWVIVGNPWPGEHWIYPLRAEVYRQEMPSVEPWRFNSFAQCANQSPYTGDCKGVVLVCDDNLPNGDGRFGLRPVNCPCYQNGFEEWPDVPPEGKVLEAYKRARGARFEHGENACGVTRGIQR